MQVTSDEKGITLFLEWQEITRLSLGYNGLTPTERQVFDMVKQGKRNKEIAQAMNISERTVKFHVTALFEKRGVKSRMEL